MNTVVLGIFHGDEGKGKIVDYLAKDYDIICRFGGGANAGHTLIVNGEKLVFRLLPSGYLHPNKTCILGRGMVIDFNVLNQELEKVTALGYRNHFYIDNGAHIVMPYHITIDEFRDAELKIGTTKKGIGPAYEDKIKRVGIRAGDLHQPQSLNERISKALKLWHGVGVELPTVEDATKYIYELSKPYKNIIIDTSDILQKSSNVLYEGAQGTLLDVDSDDYPYVTSSHTTIAGVLSGAGISHKKIDRVVGVFKAYNTRVGNGPFRTELSNVFKAEKLRNAGGEYGSVTGRPRRVGWLDLPLLRRAIQLNGVDSLCMTKLDVLSGFGDVEVLVDDNAYPYEIKKFAGWNTKIDRASNFDDLPQEAKNYIRFIEGYLGVPIELISVGASRNDILNHKEFRK